MVKEFIQIIAIQKKMDLNREMQNTVKVTVALIVFMVFFCSLNFSDTMNMEVLKR